MMMDDVANLRQGILAQPGINLRCGIKREIAKAAAGENPPQIHRHQNLNGLAALPVGHLSLLDLLKSCHHNRSQEGGSADPEAVGLRHNIFGIQGKTGQIQETVLIGRALGEPGIRFLAAGVYGTGIFLKTVLQFLFPGRLQSSQDTLFRRNPKAIALLKVFCHQTFQEYQAAVSVGKGVEKLHRNPVFIGDHPESASSDILDAHAGQGITLLCRKRRSMGNLLQVIPKYTLSQPGGDGREPAHRHIQGGGQNLAVHLFRKGGGEPEEAAPALAPGGRVDFRRVVQAHPAKLPLGREVGIEEGNQQLHILPVLLKTVEEVGVPSLRADPQLRVTALGKQFFMEVPGIAEHDLMASRKNQRRRKVIQRPKEGRSKRILRICGEAFREEPQPLLCHGHILVLVFLIGSAGRGQIRPW